MCVLLVLLAGGLAANPAWHEALHDHGDHAVSAAGHHDDGGASDHGDAGTCAVCAFAHQQVVLGWVSPITAPVPIMLERVAWPAASELRLELVWPEPSGRGPPAGV